MTKEYTPTTEDVRVRYALDRGAAIRRPYLTSLEDFDRWLNQVKAEAWDEGSDDAASYFGISESGHGTNTNPYRKKEL